MGVSAIASDLTADLAALRPRSDLGATLWRHPALVLRFYQPAVAFALRATEGRRRVLDVGSGYGTIALELARAGHEVTALDSSEEACTVARRTLAGVEATVIQSAFGSDDLHDGSFDAIRFGRSLHHMDDVGAAAERAALLLAPGGVVVIDEFCAERIDRPTATWLASITGALTQAGVVPSGAGLTDADEIVRTWTEKRQKHKLMTGEQMWRALEARFVLAEPQWYPYLWKEPAKHVEDAQRAALVAHQVEAAEAALIAAGTIPGVAFRTSGAVR
jgi:2-polyprenyl-3-methyl-5-hydroxy-6-metoxy-1,4-benzoquinol methylase